MIVQIDLQDLLQQLQILDIDKASCENLLEFSMKLDIVNASLQQFPQDFPPDMRQLVDQIIAYLEPIKNEILARGFCPVNVINLIDEDPELLAEALTEMPLMQFLDLYSQLQKDAKTDADCRPMYQLASKVLQQRIGKGGMPS